MNCGFLRGHFGGRFEVLGGFCKWNWGVRGENYGTFEKV